MKPLRHTLTIALAALAALGASAQDTSSSSSVVARRSAADRNREQAPAGLTDRMQGHYDPANSSISDADLQWMRVIYRNIDLDKDVNAPLYFPEEPVDGQENLFRIIMRLLAQGTIPAYEYLDGREVFTDKYKVPVKDILDRFYIIYQPAKGSTEKNPRYDIDESDVPANEVLSYFVIEKWTYDTRNNRLRPTIEAICPVLHRAGDFGGDAIKYPMFWLKYSDLRPYLAQQTIFVSDDNNLPTCTYDDFFNLTMYQGDIYKTRNLRNKSMAQLYPDPDDLRHAQDSIQQRLDKFEEKLWTPTREELAARAESSAGKAKKDSGSDTETVEAAAEEDKAPARAKRTTARSKKKPAKVKESSASRSSSATRSVRRRK